MVSFKVATLVACAGGKGGWLDGGKNANRRASER